MDRLPAATHADQAHPASIRKADREGPRRRFEGRFEDAVRAHELELTRLAEQLSAGQADARDLVQDTFERALRAWGRLPAGSNVRGWLVTILRNLFIDRCRHARRGQTLSIQDEVPAPAPDDAAPPWADVTPEQLRAALSELDGEFRHAYELHALEGWSYRRIADELGIPLSTVGTRLLRARRKLRVILLRSLRPEAEETRQSNNFPASDPASPGIRAQLAPPTVAGMGMQCAMTSSSSARGRLEASSPLA
jgi:RNA polymerase sigma-70 factor (ECF subfamily)